MQILSASQIHVPQHLRDQFEALRRDLLRDVQPVNALQVESFNSLLRSSWEIRRCDHAELHLAAELGVDPLVTSDKRLAGIQRTRAQAQREVRMAVSQLRRLQTDHAVRMLPENVGLRALPVAIDSKEYIAAARSARGSKKNEPITFAPGVAALDQFARTRGLGDSAWDAWRRRGFPRDNQHDSSQHVSQTQQTGTASPASVPPQHQPAPEVTSPGRG